MPTSPSRRTCQAIRSTSGDKAIEREFNYDEIAEAYAAGVDSAPYNAHYERPATLALIPDVSGAHVLDAGCGSGFYSAQLVEMGARVTAVDSSSEMIRHAMQKVTDNDAVSFHVADLGKPLDFVRDASVDGILSPLVLHYMKDWRPTLLEFARVLRNGGWLVLSTHHPGTEAVRFDVENYFETEPMQDYWSWVGTVRFFRRPLSAITNAITDAGFLIERLTEPLPDETFRAEKPDAYERILKHPEFLLVKALKKTDNA
jgi:ubiquinone/menaquinone biosynthesis C-methylase UbiE